MTPTQIIECGIFGLLLLVLAFSEMLAALHRHRIDAAAHAANYLHYCDEIVDKEMER